MFCLLFPCISFSVNPKKESHLSSSRHRLPQTTETSFLANSWNSFLNSAFSHDRGFHQIPVMRFLSRRAATLQLLPGRTRPGQGWRFSNARIYLGGARRYLGVCRCVIWMFPKMVGFPPKSSIFNSVFQYKPSILGYPYFWKHPFATFGSLHLRLQQSHELCPKVLWWSVQPPAFFSREPNPQMTQFKQHSFLNPVPPIQSLPPAVASPPLAQSLVEWWL